VLGSFCPTVPFFLPKPKVRRLFARLKAGFHSERENAPSRVSLGEGGACLSLRALRLCSGVKKILPIF